MRKVALAAMLSTLLVSQAFAAQLAGKGELQAIRCDMEGMQLVNCVAVINVSAGPKAFAIDQPYDDLVGKRVLIVNNGITNSLVGAGE